MKSIGYSYDEEDVILTADTCGFLSVLLNEKPTEELVSHLRENCSQVQTSSQMMNSKDRLNDGVCLMFKYIEETKMKAASEVAEDLAVNWTKIFRGVAPGYSPLPPCEALYIGENNQENHVKIFLEMDKEYSAYGLAVDSMHSNRPDYVGIQLTFLHYLMTQEVKFLNEENYKEAKKYREHYSKFATEHLDKWISLFCKQAEEYVKTDFYKGLLMYLPEFVFMLTCNEGDNITT